MGNIITGYYGTDGEDNELKNGFDSKEAAEKEKSLYPDEYKQCAVVERNGQYWIAY